MLGIILNCFSTRVSQPNSESLTCPSSLHANSEEAVSSALISLVLGKAPKKVGGQSAGAVFPTAYFHSLSWTCVRFSLTCLVSPLHGGLSFQHLQRLSGRSPLHPNHSTTLLGEVIGGHQHSQNLAVQELSSTLVAFPIFVTPFLTDRSNSGMRDLLRLTVHHDRAGAHTTPPAETGVQLSWLLLLTQSQMVP